MSARKKTKAEVRKRPARTTTAVERASSAWLAARSAAFAFEGCCDSQSDEHLGKLLDRERLAWLALLAVAPESVLDVKRRVRALHLFFTDLQERGEPKDNSHMLMLTAVLCDVESIGGRIEQ